MIAQGDRVEWTKARNGLKTEGTVKFLLGDKARIRVNFGHEVNVPIDRLEKL